MVKLKSLNQNVKIYFALNEESIGMETAAIWKDTIKQLSLATSHIQAWVRNLHEKNQIAPFYILYFVTHFYPDFSTRLAFFTYRGLLDNILS